MVDIYGDESESQANPRVFSLVCCIATPSAWGLFNPAWAAMLRHGGLSPVTAFHTADVVSGTGEFDGWSRQDRESLQQQAIDLILDTRLVANLYVAGCALVVDDLDLVTPGGWSKPSVADLYVKCFETVFRTAFTFSPVMGANFILDKKEKVRARVKGIFDEARANLPSQLTGRLEKLRFADDRNEIPLQVADLIAFEWRRRVWEKRSRPDAPVRGEYSRLFGAFETLERAKPPYRVWNMRCYDKIFIERLRAIPLPGDGISDFWFDVPVAHD